MAGCKVTAGLTASQLLLAHTQQRRCPGRTGVLKLLQDCRGHAPMADLSSYVTPLEHLRNPATRGQPAAGARRMRRG